MSVGKNDVKTASAGVRDVLDVCVCVVMFLDIRCCCERIEVCEDEVP